MDVFVPFSHPCARNILLFNCSTCCSNKRKDASLSEVLFNRKFVRKIFSPVRHMLSVVSVVNLDCHSVEVG